MAALTTHRTTRLLLGALLGALPGLVLLALAAFVVDGEQELTIGVAGMWLAAIGAVVGAVLVWVRSRPGA